jgi:hypothetical protein
MPKLAVPYKSQWDSDAQLEASDCGPTSLAMLCAATGDPVSPDSLYQYINRIDPTTGQKKWGTNASDLVKAAKARGLVLNRKTFLPASAVDDLKRTVDAGTPFIALVNYAFWDPIVHNNFKGPHFVLVVGYDNANIYIHDPLFRGNRREQGNYWGYAYKDFTAAWGGCSIQYNNPNYLALISAKAVPFVDQAPARPTTPPTTPATKPTTPAQPKLDDELRRRLRAKAAYDGLPDPNLDDAKVANDHLARLGNWGATADSYTVRRGDSLSGIATLFYGDRAKWKVIVYYNNITHPSLVEPGETYLIPNPEPKDNGVVPLPGFGGPTS